MTWDRFTSTLLPLITLLLGAGLEFWRERWREGKDRDRDLWREENERERDLHARVVDREDTALVDLQDQLLKLPRSLGLAVEAVVHHFDSGAQVVSDEHARPITEWSQARARALMLTTRVCDDDLRATIAAAIDETAGQFDVDRIHELRKEGKIIDVDLRSAWPAINSASFEIGRRLRGLTSRA